MSGPSPWGAEPPLIDPAEFRKWIILEEAELLVLNKPGWVVCHPSKRGPWSSLVGAAREYLTCERLHLVSRLDRETSGLVLIARNRKAARDYQGALERGWAEKSYLAILEGELGERREVSAPLERDPVSPVAVKVRVARDGGGSKAQTSFIPVHTGGGFTLAEVIPYTGRKHQIRVHAQWIGFPVAGDKLYGPDERLYLEFVERGWSERHARVLVHTRQALHASELRFPAGSVSRAFHAPLPEDFRGLADSLWSDWSGSGVRS